MKSKKMIIFGLLAGVFVVWTFAFAGNGPRWEERGMQPRWSESMQRMGSWQRQNIWSWEIWSWNRFQIFCISWSVESGNCERPWTWMMQPQTGWRWSWTIIDQNDVQPKETLFKIVFRRLFGK